LAQSSSTRKRNIVIFFRVMGFLCQFVGFVLQIFFICDKSINKMCNNNGNKCNNIKNNNKTYKTSLPTSMINKRNEMRKYKSNAPQLNQSQTDFTRKQSFGTVLFNEETKHCDFLSCYGLFVSICWFCTTNIFHFVNLLTNDKRNKINFKKYNIMTIM
jgi:hypothetical protein